MLTYRRATISPIGQPHFPMSAAPTRGIDLTERFLSEPSSLPQVHVRQGSLADYDQLLDHPEQFDVSQEGAA